MFSKGEDVLMLMLSRDPLFYIFHTPMSELKSGIKVKVREQVPLHPSFPSFNSFPTMPPTFIILAVTTLLFFALYGIRWLQVQHTINRSKHTTPLETHPLATVWLRKANLLISQSVFLPVLIRVYLLGMIETLVTVIWKRGLLGAPNVKDTERAIDRLLVHQNGRVNRTAIVTGNEEHRVTR